MLWILLFATKVSPFFTDAIFLTVAKCFKNLGTFFDILQTQCSLLLQQICMSIQMRNNHRYHIFFLCEDLETAEIKSKALSAHPPPLGVEEINLQCLWCCLLATHCWQIVTARTPYDNLQNAWEQLVFLAVLNEKHSFGALTKHW